MRQTDITLIYLRNCRASSAKLWWYSDMSIQSERIVRQRAGIMMQIRGDYCQVASRAGLARCHINPHEVRYQLLLRRIGGFRALARVQILSRKLLLPFLRLLIQFPCNVSFLFVPAVSTVLQLKLRRLIPDKKLMTDLKQESMMSWRLSSRKVADIKHFYNRT